MKFHYFESCFHYDFKEKSETLNICISNKSDNAFWRFKLLYKKKVIL